MLRKWLNNWGLVGCLIQFPLKLYYKKPFYWKSDDSHFHSLKWFVLFTQMEYLDWNHYSLTFMKACMLSSKASKNVEWWMGDLVPVNWKFWKKCYLLISWKRSSKCTTLHIEYRSTWWQAELKYQLKNRRVTKIFVFPSKNCALYAVFYKFCINKKSEKI